MEKVDLEVYNKIIISTNKNYRPSMTGKTLNTMKELNKNDFMLEFNSIKNSLIAKDYLVKNDGSIRKNVYMVSPFIVNLINYYGYKIFEQENIMQQVYYSGNYIEFDFFYMNSYEIFQKKLICECSNYVKYVKVDVKNFYGNVSLKYLKKFNNKYIDSVLEIFSILKINEYPIIQDCAGLSYIAVKFYIESIYKEILKIRKSFNIGEIISYSDDLYLLLYDEVDIKELKRVIEDIYKKYGLRLNDKFKYESIDDLPFEVQQKVYDYYVNEDEFNIVDVLGGELKIEDRIINFISKLKSVNTYEEYNELLEDSFSFFIGNKKQFKKNLFNEILYNRKLQYLLRRKVVLDELKKVDLINRLKYDPTRITRLLLFSRNEKLIKKFLYKMYSKLENSVEQNYHLQSVIVYITQRKINKQTCKKFIEKLSNNHNDLSNYIDKYIK